MELDDTQVIVALIAAIPTIIGSILVYFASIKTERKEDPRNPNNTQIAEFLLERVNQLMKDLEKSEARNKELQKRYDSDTV